MAVRCILWDFGDTLVDQDWMLKAPETYPGWSKAWVEIARGENEERWNLGEITCDDVASQIARRLGMSLAEAIAHIQLCCSSVRFFEAPLMAVRRSRLPQAIVTVNPDLFTKYVVPAFRLNEMFPVIVTSWQEKTTSKVALCEKALRALGQSIERSEAILIDNVPDNVRDWEAAGGQGYVFQGEAQFAADLGSSLRELAVGGAAQRGDATDKAS